MNFLKFNKIVKTYDCRYCIHIYKLLNLKSVSLSYNLILISYISIPYIFFIFLLFFFLIGLLFLSFIFLFLPILIFPHSNPYNIIFTTNLIPHSNRSTHPIINFLTNIQNNHCIIPTMINNLYLTFINNIQHYMIILI